MHLKKMKIIIQVNFFYNFLVISLKQNETHINYNYNNIIKNNLENLSISNKKEKFLGKKIKRISDNDLFLEEINFLVEQTVVNLNENQENLISADITSEEIKLYKDHLSYMISVSINYEYENISPFNLKVNISKENLQKKTNLNNKKIKDLFYDHVKLKFSI